MSNEMILPDVGMESFEAVLGPAVGVLAVVFLFILFFAVLIGGAFYVMQSLGLYTLAKRRGIHHPWLAWVPLGSEWILGSLSDQYQYVAKGNIRNRRKVLLILQIVMLVLTVPMLIWGFGLTMDALAALENGTAPDMMMGSFVTVSLGNLVTSGLSIAVMVFYYIALYDLFQSCCPNTSLAFLLLGIFLPWLIPIFLLISRNKDEGMPPRKQPQPVEAPPEYL